MQELVNEVSLSSGGSTKELPHGITIRIDTIQPTVKIMVNRFNPKDDDTKIEESLRNENIQLKNQILEILRKHTQGGNI